MNNIGQQQQQRQMKPNINMCSFLYFSIHPFGHGLHLET